MKAKRVSVIAKNVRARATVFAGRKEKTSGGMTKAKLMKNKYGKIVSKAASVSAKKRYAKTLGRWTAAVVAARKALGITGFLLVNGKSAQGKAVYAKARSIYEA